MSGQIKVSDFADVNHATPVPRRLKMIQSQTEAITCRGRNAGAHPPCGKRPPKALIVTQLRFYEARVRVAPKICQGKFGKLLQLVAYD